MLHQQAEEPIDPGSGARPNPKFSDLKAGRLITESASQFHFGESLSEQGTNLPPSGIGLNECAITRRLI
ncbi:hypothetical protein [Edaphobacter dinghuensis]|uniref:Uncharacterized protein n=1 Tax=Edaphobacter dinghuensis TaxID=1560005 RepID=A0A917HQ35_9BACT|nr:hypothetical protein [Edaphobacter dinghuensis]GGG86723.1 hypothetical protein GCM10011585_33360 [Edaphobacter dinghuensis]